MKKKQLYKMFTAAGLAAVSALMLFSACDDGFFGPLGPLPNEYTVTYNINGGSGSTPSSQTVKPGRDVYLPSGSGFSRSGFTFGGWSTNSSGTGGNNYSGNSYFTPYGNITLYARWVSSGGGGVSGGTLSYGGQNYRTVIIGGKRWMAENLNYQTSNSWCYNNNTSNCNTYGRLYTWDAAMSACPSGWRLPNDNDWDNLMTAVGGFSTAGTRLKSTSGWSSGGNGTDQYGFSALPGGIRLTDGSFYGVGSWGSWWSATEGDASDARGRGMGYGYSYVYSRWDTKGGGFSVRCSQD